jgi:hypothetical protein
MLNIATLNHDDIKDARELLAERERALQQEALHVLEDRPIKHALQLIVAAVGFKTHHPPLPEEPSST